MLLDQAVLGEVALDSVVHLAEIHAWEVPAVRVGLRRGELRSTGDVPHPEMCNMVQPFGGCT